MDTGDGHDKQAETKTEDEQVTETRSDKQNRAETRVAVAETMKHQTQRRRGTPARWEQQFDAACETEQQC